MATSSVMDNPENKAAIKPPTEGEAKGMQIENHKRSNQDKITYCLINRNIKSSLIIIYLFQQYTIFVKCM